MHINIQRSNLAHWISVHPNHAKWFLHPKHIAYYMSNEPPITGEEVSDAQWKKLIPHLRTSQESKKLIGDK